MKKNEKNVRTKIEQLEGAKDPLASKQLSEDELRLTVGGLMCCTCEAASCTSNCDTDYRRD